MSGSLAQNYARVRQAVDQACAAAGRGGSEVRLLPVSKTHPVEAIREVMASGCAQFGENRVREMVGKAEELPGASWVLVGHLQRNKVRVACSVMGELQSLDSLSLASALEEHYATAYPEDRLRVLVEVNTSGEATKGGVAGCEVMGFTRSLRDYEHLDPHGLMTVAHPNPVLAEKGFEAMADLRRQLRDRDGEGWEELSMGMSGDFEAAIAHGSTCVRIGTGIFGQRRLTRG